VIPRLSGPSMSSSLVVSRSSSYVDMRTARDVVFAFAAIVTGTTMITVTHFEIGQVTVPLISDIIAVSPGRRAEKLDTRQTADIIFVSWSPRRIFLWWVWMSRWINHGGWHGSASQWSLLDLIATADLETRLIFSSESLTTSRFWPVTLSINCLAFPRVLILNRTLDLSGRMANTDGSFTAG